MSERIGRIALLLALVILMIWFWLLRSRGEKEAVPAQVSAPAGFEEPERLVFRVGSDSVVVERDGEEYWIVWPFFDRASITRIKDIARSALDLEPTRVLAEDTGRYGLNPPRSMLTLKAASGRIWTLALGDTSALGGEVYARVQGTEQPVFLMRAFTARRHFQPDASWLRDPVALPLDSPVVDSVHVWNRTHPLRARRTDADRWVALSPPGLALDPLPINRTIRELRSPNLTGFETQLSAVEAGLDPPRARWMIFQGARSETVAIGGFADSTGSELYVRPSRRPVIARMSSDFFRDLVDGWPALAALNLLEGSADSVETIEFIEGGDGGSYRRKSDTWIREPSGITVGNGEALEFDLGNLLELRWSRYPIEPVEPHGSRLTLRLQFPARAETLWLTAAPGDSTALGRSSLRRRSGRIDATQFFIWSYRALHPEM